jgi:hypothetical protein
MHPGKTATQHNVALGGAVGGYSIAGSAGYTTLAGIGDTGRTVHEFQGLDLRITVANGGYIISIAKNNYGQSPDLYIVNEDQDLGTEIGKIITMVYLKKETE